MVKIATRKEDIDLHSDFSGIISEVHLVLKSVIHEWIRKFDEELPIVTEKGRRNLISLQ